VTPEPAPSFFAARKTIFKLLAVPATAIVVLASVVLFGSTSHKLHTGSVAALEVAVTEYLRLEGLPAADVTVAASISTVDSYWGEFFVAPSAPRYDPLEPGEYGFAQFEHHQVTLPDRTGTFNEYEWVVVVAGAKSVGCPNVGAPTVPLAVLAGFRLSCPP
jgi:hypothetical protein